MRAFFTVAVVALAACASAQNAQQEEKYPPVPYQFAYKSETGGGSHSQEETSDGNGRVQGSYSLSLADGRQRTVTYWADETGFHAEVNTNELGTESKDAADAKYSSSAITGEQAAVQYGPAAPAENVNTYKAPAPVAKAEVVAPAPVVNTYQTTPTVVKTYQAAPTVVKTYQTAPAPVVNTYQTAPTVVKTYQTAPVIKTYATAPVVKTYTQAAPIAFVKTAPTVVKTVQTTPVQYAYAHASPVTYTSHAPVTYTSHAPVTYSVDGDYHHVVGKA